MDEEKKQLSEKDKLFKAIRFLIYFVIGFFIFSIILIIVASLLTGSS